MTFTNECEQAFQAPFVINQNIKKLLETISLSLFHHKDGRICDKMYDMGETQEDDIIQPLIISNPCEWGRPGARLSSCQGEENEWQYLVRLEC